MRTGDIAQRIHPADGYCGEPIFQGFRSGKFPYDFCHYSYEMDSQVRVPIRPREELKKELGL